MLNKMQDWLSVRGDRSPTSVIAKLAARNPSEQVKASRAELIATYDAVPDAFKDFFFITDEQEFPYTVRTPSYEVFIHRATEKLVCDLGREIYVLEKSGASFEAQCYPVDRICYVEFKNMLLNSSIKICGVTKEGVPNSSIFRFSALSDYLFIPILQKMRHAEVDAQSAPDRAELEKFDAWHSVNLKFMNYAKRSLLAGEKVVHTIFQPEIREAIFQLWGRAYSRGVAPTLACILTNRELIVIQEEKYWGGEDKYGGIWDYIPLKKIITLSLSEKEKNLLELSVQLTEGTRLKYLFQLSAKRDLNRLQYHFNELMMT